MDFMGGVQKLLFFDRSSKSGILIPAAKSPGIALGIISGLAATT